MRSFLGFHGDGAICMWFWSRRAWINTASEQVCGRDHGASPVRAA